VPRVSTTTVVPSRDTEEVWLPRFHRATGAGGTALERSTSQRVTSVLGLVST
jgi:hypothetical protein